MGDTGACACACACACTCACAFACWAARRCVVARLLMAATSQSAEPEHRGSWRSSKARNACSRGLGDADGLRRTRRLSRRVWRWYECGHYEVGARRHGTRQLEREPVLLEATLSRQEKWPFRIQYGGGDEVPFSAKFLFPLTFELCALMFENGSNVRSQKYLEKIL